LLQSSGILPIERAEMKVMLEIPQKDAKKLKEKVHKLYKKLEKEEFNDTCLEIVNLSKNYFKIKLYNLKLKKI
jgi:hypothetical protein